MLDTNKKIIRWNKAHDINGNAIAKVFYEDGTTDMVDNEETDILKERFGVNSHSKLCKSRKELAESN